MAKRRIDKKFLGFLIVITVAVISIATAGLLYQKLRPHRGNARQLENSGDTALAQGDVEKAARLFAQACGAAPDDTSLVVKLGSALERLTEKDPAYLGQARAQYNRAISIDPRCTPALEKLLASYEEESKLLPSAAVFGEIRSTCDKLLAVRPADQDAAKTKQLAIIQQWLANQTLSSDEVRKCVDVELPSLIAKNPDDADLPKALADAHVQQAKESLNADDKVQARLQLTQATRVLDDATKGREKNAAVQFRAFQGYGLIELADPDAKTKEKKKYYEDRMDACLQAALSQATTLDPNVSPLCVDIVLTASRWDAQHGKTEAQEKLVTDFYNAHGASPYARLAMAQMLERRMSEPKVHDQILSILSTAATTQPALAGFKAILDRDIRAQLLVELIRVRMSDFSRARAAPERSPSEAVDSAASSKEISAKIDEELDQLRRLCQAHSVPVLDLEGRMHLVKGEDVEAVKTLEEAASLMPASKMDYDLLYQLAAAYLRTGQSGLARQKLEQIVLQLDSWAPPRMMLADILLGANELQAAFLQIHRLREIAPDNEQTKRLESELVLLNHENQPQEAAATYSGLKETTRNERLVKARIAIVLNRGDEAARLFSAVLKETPGDPEASLKLASVYAGALGQPETAKTVLAAALQLHPDDPALVQADCGLRGLLPQDANARILKAVEKTADPFLREMQMYQLEASPGGHPERELSHLLAAVKAQPENTTGLDTLFERYVATGKFNEAAPIVEKLASLNADRCGGLMYRYRVAFAKGDLAGAEDFGRQLVEHYQEFAAGWLRLAQVLEARGRFDEATKDYREVLNRQPNQPDAYRGLVNCYYRLNQGDDAKLVLLEARKAYPKDQLFRDALLAHYVNFGEAALAVPERESILKANLQRRVDTAEDYLALAKAYFHAAQDVAVTKPPEAKNLLNKAFQALGDGKEKFPQFNEFYAQMAEMYLYNRDLKSGESLLMQWHDEPSMAGAIDPALALSQFYQQAGNEGLSLKYMKEAVANASAGNYPRATDLKLQLAALFGRMRDFPQAYATLDSIAVSEQSDPRIIRQRIETLLAEGQRAKAKKDIEDQLSKRDAIDLRELLASILIDDHKFDAAVVELDHVLERDPKNDSAIFLQSLAVAKQGDVGRAITQLVSLRNRDPKNARVRMLLGELYSKTGRPDYAIRELIDAIGKMPLDRDVRVALIRLYREKSPMTADDWNAVLALCNAAEHDPVLRIDPTWAREEALALTAMSPPRIPDSIVKWQEAIALAPTNFGFRREFVDVLLSLHDYPAAYNETEKLLKEGRKDWWVYFQRGLALVAQKKKPEAMAEFEAAMAAPDLTTNPDIREFVLRGVGFAVGYDIAVQHVKPLLGSDPDNRWHLVQAALLRAAGDYGGAADIIAGLLADPANAPAQRRIPILRAQSDIWTSRPSAEKMDVASSQAGYLKARDAYIELIKLVPDDLYSLNNLATLLVDQISPPNGGALKAKPYSARAYELLRADPHANVFVLDTHGWVLTLCGGDDALEGMRILRSMIEDRQDTKTFIDGRYHLGEAYLRAANPDPVAAQKWLKEALALTAEREKAGQAVDLVLKDKIQNALSKATSPVISRN